MKRSTYAAALPLPVKRALAKLGSDMADARKRRRIQTTTMAERAFISRSTLYKVEKGDPGVPIATYVTVLWVLGMVDRIVGLADGGSDELGRALEDQALPKRIRN